MAFWFQCVTYVIRSWGYPRSPFLQSKRLGRLQLHLSKQDTCSYLDRLDQAMHMIPIPLQAVSLSHRFSIGWIGRLIAAPLGENHTAMSGGFCLVHGGSKIGDSMPSVTRFFSTKRDDWYGNWYEVSRKDGNGTSILNACLHAG